VVARRAFAPVLPPAIAWRRSKGSPDHFVSALYEGNRQVLGELLGEGLLASHGLIDRDDVLAELSREGPIKGHEHARLLQIADVEAWARSL
jgi:asparagine synthase (glutamine-hydrolysing)